MSGNERSRSIFKSGYNWAIDFVIDRWPQLLTLLLTTGGFSYLASISQVLSKWGVIGWVGVGLVLSLVTGLIVAVFTYARYKSTMATLEMMRATSASTNVLAPTHDNERMNLIDFFRPGFQVVEKVRFANCQFFGPMNLAIEENTFHKPVFINCEVVIIPSGAFVRNCLMFKSCQVIDSTFYGVTLLLTKGAWENLPEVARAKLPVISDTTLDGVP